jgi:hypothetical protein
MAPIVARGWELLTCVGTSGRCLLLNLRRSQSVSKAASQLGPIEASCKQYPFKSSCDKLRKYYLAQCPTLLLSDSETSSYFFTSLLPSIRTHTHLQRLMQ